MIDELMKNHARTYIIRYQILLKTLTIRVFILFLWQKIYNQPNKIQPEQIYPFPKHSQTKQNNTQSQFKLLLLVLQIITLQDLMQIITVLRCNALEHIIREIPILSHLLLHFLPLPIQPLKLILKPLEQLTHLHPQRDTVLRSIVLLVRQFDTDIVDGYSFLKANTLYFPKIKGASLIVGDIVHQGLFDPQVGDLLEVYQQFISHILQSHALSHSAALRFADLLKHLPLQFLQTVIPLPPGRHIALGQPESLPLGLPPSEIFDGSHIGTILLPVHQRKDLHVLYISQLAGSLLGQTEQSFKLCLREQFLFGDAFELDYGQFIENGWKFIFDIVLKLFDALLALVLKGSEVKIGVLTLVFFYLVTQVQLLLSLQKPTLQRQLPLCLCVTCKIRSFCLAVLEVYCVEWLPIVKDYRIEESEPRQLRVRCVEMVQKIRQI